MNPDNRCIRCGKVGHRSHSCKQPILSTTPAPQQTCSSCLHKDLPTTQEPCRSCDREWRGPRLVSTNWEAA